MRALLDRSSFTTDDELNELNTAKQLGKIPIVTRAEIKTFVVRALTDGVPLDRLAYNQFIGTQQEEGRLANARDSTYFGPQVDTGYDWESQGFSTQEQIYSGRFIFKGIIIKDRNGQVLSGQDNPRVGS